jgi:hypothetical protein
MWLGHLNRLVFDASEELDEVAACREAAQTDRRNDRDGRRSRNLHPDELFDRAQLRSFGSIAERKSRAAGASPRRSADAVDVGKAGHGRIFSVWSDHLGKGARNGNGAAPEWKRAARNARSNVQ